MKFCFVFIAMKNRKLVKWCYFSLRELTDKTVTEPSNSLLKDVGHGLTWTETYIPYIGTQRKKICNIPYVGKWLILQMGWTPHLCPVSDTSMVVSSTSKTSPLGQDGPLAL